MYSIPLKKALVTAATVSVALAMVVAPIGGGAARTAGANGGPKDFTILHTNDEHSELIPYDLSIDYPGSPTLGGFSRIARTIADIKAAKAAAGEPVLTVSAGDWSQGTLFSWLTPVAAPELTLMQQMTYDATVLGNHDVELGPGYTAMTLAAAKANGVDLPILSSNIQFSGYPPAPGAPDEALYAFWSATDQQRADLFVQPYTTKTLSNGLKVGMFGLLGVEAEQVAPGMAPLKFGNVPGDDLASFFARVGTAAAMENTLRTTEGCDVVVCLSHMGTDEEKLLSAFVPTIDVIIGGHSHDLNYPPFTWGPGGTILVQAKAYTQYLGQLELNFDPAATGPKVTVRSGRAILMDETVGTVPAIDTAIDGYLTALEGQLGFDPLAPYAETDVSGDGGFPLLNRPAKTETNLGNLIADTYLTAANEVIGTEKPALFALEANGVIRSDLVKGATGVFSFYDLYHTLPLGGSPYSMVPGYPLTSFYLYGGEIEGVMNALLDLDRNDFFLQVSGLKMAYDPKAGDDEKLLSLSVRDASGKFAPVQPGTLYRLVANYYTGLFLGQFGLLPRFENGAQNVPTPGEPDPMKPFILHTGGAGGARDASAASELKAWQALTGTVAAMPDLDGDTLANVPATYYPTQGRINRLETSFYFAEGTTRPGFDQYIAIQNPGATEAKVKATYMPVEGETKSQVITVPPGSRGTLRPADMLGTGDGPAYDFSAKVECTNGQQIIVERPMYFNYGGAWPGGHDVTGTAGPSATFYFAEGTTRPGFDPYLTVQNPGAADASVTITYMKGDGASDTQDINVPAGSRTTVVVRDKLGQGDGPAYDFSAKVECTNDQQVVAERPMYFNYGAKNWTGGSTVIGATSASSLWHFAEGSTRPGFDSYISILNPGTKDAAVRVTYMKGDGTSAVEERNVPAGSRSTVNAKDKLGEGADAAHDFSAMVETTNNTQVVAERPVYFDYQGRDGGHAVVGAPMPSTTFYFAEGTTRPGFNPYISIMNPSSSEAKVKVTYMLGDGSMKSQVINVPGRSRRTLHPPDEIGIGDSGAYDFSARVVSTNGMPIVAERPIYFDYGGWTGGTNVLGF